jgi:DNA helicase-4
MSGSRSQKNSKTPAFLSRQQTKAIISDNRRVLVLAGAGAGKTKTLLEKIIYLIQHKNVKPQEILAITFTKNAANEMLDRLIASAEDQGDFVRTITDKHLNEPEKRKLRRKKLTEHKWISRLTVRTFHSLCYSIMKNYGVKAFDNKFKIVTDAGVKAEEMSRISAPESQYEIMHKILIKLCEDRDWLLHFKRYIIDYMVDRIHLENRDFIQNYPEGKYYTTLKGDKVRSKSEQYIADWLYRHNIQYLYEPQVSFSDFSFRPDFFIPGANLYLEHISDRSAPMQEKEKQFIKSGHTLVCTYEHMTRDSNLFNLALTRIVKGRLPANYTAQTILSYEEEMKNHGKEVRDFLQQVIRVLDMCQADGIDLENLKQKISTEPHERVRLFYDCCLPMIQQYKIYCVEKSYLDFNQLIEKSITLLQTNEGIKALFHRRYKYMLVDEFQDVNKIQIQFIRSILNPKAQLFCVGDDWQSIYGFRGSDVKYIVEFSRYFVNSKIFHLSTNYRSTDPIVKASNEVIAHNKYKVEKKIKAARKSKRKIEIYAGTGLEDNVEYVLQEIRELIKKGIGEEDILFLYRRSKMFDPYRTRFKKEKIHINAKTIHAAKGLESRVVFIIGMTEGYGGFPDIWMGDRIYQMIRPVKHEMLLEEERRLFYVAITRAKERLYLISEIGAESSFIHEIPEGFKVFYNKPLQTGSVQMIHCTSCKSSLEPGYRFCPYCGSAI